MLTLNNGKVPVKIWTDSIDQMALQQLRNLSQLDIIHSHVAAMADVHGGMGSTIGSVIPTYKAVIPAAVGVDIGCGMVAVKLSINARQLPDSLHELRCEIESRIPHGRTNNGKASSDEGGWRGNPSSRARLRWRSLNIENFIPDVLNKHKNLINDKTNSINHLGTLGGGNHFIEICLDEDDNVWIMLHSGSRGIGNRIGSYFISLAKEEMHKIGYKVSDNNLAYFTEESDYFNDYCEAVGWAQHFARANRDIMLKETFYAIKDVFKNYNVDVYVKEKAINCHHNYVSKEDHFGEQVYVTRKGAIAAHKGEKGIIPGSMGAKSFIVEGLGNEESFCSCSHGAGRIMSRTEAKRHFTVEDVAEQTKGIECRKDSGVIDEIPGAYKDIDQVMKNQRDLVKVVHTLKQIVNIKG